MRDRSAKIEKIKQMTAQGSLVKDIAKEFNVNPNTMSVFLRKHGIENRNRVPLMGKWNAKHKHLRKEVMEYFLTHSGPETMLKFNLTNSEFKSLMTVGYKQPEFSHLRKDTRQNQKNKWTEFQIKQMLQMSGLRPRNVIAEKIGRGNSRVIKEKLQHLGMQYPKYLNGLSLNRFRDIFGFSPEFFIQTDAGPGSGKYSATFFKIVPWVYIRDLVRSQELNTSEMLKKWIFAMAEFQDWFHEGNAYANLLDTSLEIS